jgi:hypothetical protein
MTPEEKERVEWLIKQIQVEQNQDIFGGLVQELNQILARKGARLSDLPDSATSHSGAMPLE